MEEGELRDDRPYWVGTAWYESGRIMCESKEKHLGGAVLARMTIWYENGRKKDEIEFRDGQFVSHVSWYGNGRKMREREYRDGRVISQNYWTENGRLKSQWQYRAGGVWERFPPREERRRDRTDGWESRTETLGFQKMEREIYLDKAARPQRFPLGSCPISRGKGV